LLVKDIVDLTWEIQHARLQREKLMRPGGSLACSRQTSITAGTAMHRSKLALPTWFWAAHLMATHSNGMSARQLEDQLGVTYKTAWLLAQKLRRSMIDPTREPLESVVEID